MKQNFILPLIIGLLFSFLSCKNDSPEVADITKISVTTLHETIICQPIHDNNGLIAIIYKDDQAQLCSYKSNDETTNYNWIYPIEQYGFGGNSPIYADNLKLRRNSGGEIFMQLSNSFAGYIKSVKFGRNGNFQWQKADSIHQPTEIDFGVDIIDLTIKEFKLGGLVPRNDGGFSVISSIDSMSIDTTYLQRTVYSSDGNFIVNSYYRLPGSFQISDVYKTSDDNLFLVTDGRGTNVSQFRLIDTTGTVLFNYEPRQDNGQPIHILGTHLFFENSDGNYIGSISFLENSNLAHGLIFCIDKTGNLLWYSISDIDNTGGLMLSVIEQVDGYLFSGIKTSSAVFDWRLDFDLYDFQAVLMKTNLSGEIQWHNNDLFNNSYFKSAGAGVIINNEINMFLSRDDGPVKNISILKLNDNGEIKN